MDWTGFAYDEPSFEAPNFIVWISGCLDFEQRFVRVSDVLTGFLGLKQFEACFMVAALTGYELCSF